MCVIVCSGIDYSHPDLKDRFVLLQDGNVKHADFVNKDEGGRDYDGHGTHVAGE